MKNLINITLFLLIITSCSKKETEHLPPITTSGQDSFGCYIDGKLFLNKDDPSLWSGTNETIITDFVNVSDTIVRTTISFKNLVSHEKLVFIFPDLNTLKTGTYPLNDAELYPEFPHIGNSPFSVYFSNIGNAPQEDIFYSEKESGEIIILKVDSENKIISASFSFNLKNLISDKSISITSGRFDIHYY